jgi:hypothetical protein
VKEIFPLKKNKVLFSQLAAKRPQTMMTKTHQERSELAAGPSKVPKESPTSKTN